MQVHVFSASHPDFNSNMFSFRHDSNPSVRPRKNGQGVSKRYRFNESQVWAKLPKTGQSRKSYLRQGPANSGQVAFIDESEELKRNYTETSPSDLEEAEPILASKDPPKAVDFDGYSANRHALLQILPSSHGQDIEHTHFPENSLAHVTTSHQLFNHAQTIVSSQATPERSSIVSQYGQTSSAGSFLESLASAAPGDLDLLSGHQPTTSPNLSHHSQSGSQPCVSWPLLDHKEASLLRYFIDNLSGWVRHSDLGSCSFGIPTKTDCTTY